MIGFRASVRTAVEHELPGQSTSDPVHLLPWTGAADPIRFDLYNNNGRHQQGDDRLPTTRSIKCYDGMHNWNQLQPAPYDGMYQFPSVTVLTRRPESRPAPTARSARPMHLCIPNPDCE